jgi:hypothetical protein
MAKQEKPVEYIWQDKELRFDTKPAFLACRRGTNKQKVIRIVSSFVEPMSLTCFAEKQLNANNIHIAYMYTFMYTSIYIHKHICMYIYIYIYVYI